MSLAVISGLLRMMPQIYLLIFCNYPGTHTLTKHGSLATIFQTFQGDVSFKRCDSEV